MGCRMDGEGENRAFLWSSSGLGYTLHPLVLINISDHFTRTKVNAPEGDGAEGAGCIPRVMGCLLGQQKGLTVDISNSFEVNSRSDDWKSMDLEFLHKKLEQYKQTFPDLDVVGWYSTGTRPLLPSDLDVQKDMTALNESPLFLLLNPSLIDQTDGCDVTMKESAEQQRGPELPVTLFESEMHVVSNKTEMRFVQAKFSVATSEAERIGVDQVAKILTSGASGASDQYVSHLNGVQQAVQTLVSRLKQIVLVLKRMETGEIPFDPVVARQAAALVARLPATETHSDTVKELSTETSDAMMSVLLASVTKGCTRAIDLIDKHNLAYDKNFKTKRLGKTTNLGDTPAGVIKSRFASGSSGL